MCFEFEIEKKDDFNEYVSDKNLLIRYYLLI